MSNNNFLSLRANLSLNSPLPCGRVVGGRWEYASRKNCLFHYFQMCMYMRRNFTTLSVESLMQLMSLPKRRIYEVTFSRGFNPQDDDHILDLAMLMQRYESSLQGDEIMTASEISEQWKYFTRVLSCL